MVVDWLGGVMRGATMMGKSRIGREILNPDVRWNLWIGGSLCRGIDRVSTKDYRTLSLKQ